MKKKYIMILLIIAQKFRFNTTFFVMNTYNTAFDALNEHVIIKFV